MIVKYWEITDLLNSIGKIRKQIHRQNYDAGIRWFKDVFLPVYQRVWTSVVQDEENWLTVGIEPKELDLNGITEYVLQAQAQQDYMLMADYMVLLLKPVLLQLLEAIRNHSDIIGMTNNTSLNQWKQPETFHSDRELIYQPELTQEGSITIRVQKGEQTFYLHSNESPWSEAADFAEAYADDLAEEYAVLGLGLGYHALELWRRTEGAQPVHVYEADGKRLSLSLRYINYSQMYGKDFYIHYDPDFTKLSDHLKRGAKLVIHEPSLRCLPNGKMKKIFTDYYIRESSEKNQIPLLQANFNRNRKMNLSAVESLKGSFTGKEIFIVAAGPSLDKNVSLLKKRPDNSILLAVGTVFEKLLRLGITPDYVIITDANKRVKLQIEGTNAQISKVPLIILSTAYYKLSENYTGEKYIAFQKDFERSEKYAEENERMLFETGGSVSTTALDLAIRLGAATIVFSGLDLAFTNNLAHASGTSNQIATDNDELQPVKGYDGQTVYADAKFIMYRKWIEERLTRKDVSKIDVINATEGGSYIAGMRHITLREVIEETKGTAQ